MLVEGASCRTAPAAAAFSTTKPSLLLRGAILARLVQGVTWRDDSSAAMAAAGIRAPIGRDSPDETPPKLPAG